MKYIVFYTQDYAATYSEFYTEKDVLSFIKGHTEPGYDGSQILKVFYGEEMDVKPVEVVTRYELVAKEDGK